MQSSTAAAPTMANAIFWAAHSGDVDRIVKALETNEVQVDCQAPTSRTTLLHIGSIRVNCHLVRTVLRFGPNPAIRDAKDMTALEHVTQLQEMAGPARSSLCRNLAAVRAMLEGYERGGLESIEDLDDGEAGVRDTPPNVRGSSAPGALEGTDANPSQMSFEMRRAATCQPVPNMAQAQQMLRGRLEGGTQMFSDITMLRITSEGHAFPTAPHQAGPEAGQDGPADGFGQDLQAGGEQQQEGADAALGKEEEKETAPAAAEEPVGPVFKCGICLDDVSVTQRVPRLCLNEACEGDYCAACLQQYFTVAVTTSLYSVPPMRCCSCNSRIPTANWKSRVDPDVFVKYQQNAFALLKYRCSDCHVPQDLFGLEVAQDAVERTARAEQWFAAFKPKDKRRVLDVWGRFSRGAADANELAQALLQGVRTPASFDLFPDCNAFTHPCPDPNEDDYITVGHLLVRELLPLVRDMERRCALQLAWMSLQPRFRTWCCNRPMCFKCKIDGWHEGMTCAEVQAQEVGTEAQYCPTCNVPTIKSEGCTSMVCVCGTYWDWQESE